MEPGAGVTTGRIIDGPTALYRYFDDKDRWSREDRDRRLLTR
jgi:hypothetical protein